LGVKSTRRRADKFFAVLDIHRVGCREERSQGDVYVFANASSSQLARIDAILGQLDQSQGPNSNANRRRAQRMNIRTEMRAQVLSEISDATLSIFTRNLSTSGIGFVCRRMCKVGERLALTFELPGKPRKLVLAKITFCRYVPGGLYDAGAEFIECVAAKGSHDRVPLHWMHMATIQPTLIKEPPARAARQAS
jgi:hypothetical protein